MLETPASRPQYRDHDAPTRHQPAHRRRAAHVRHPYGRDERAAFVQVGNDVFTAGYLHAPDEFTRPDDVLVEGTREDQELLLIQRDFEGAKLLGEGEICLRDGTLIRFLRPAAVH